MDNLLENFEWIERRLNRSQPIEKIGRVAQVTGLIIESEGPEVSLGAVCDIYSNKDKLVVTAEVVGFRDNRVLLMALGTVSDLHPGCRVVASNQGDHIPVGMGLLGRIIDGMGRPLDGKGPLRVDHVEDLHRDAPNPLKRRRIAEPFTTGVRSIDAFTPLGCGQRMGIFAGSGVGKSTLLGMIARGADSEVNVVALIGERGRELREFLENDLSEAGLARSVVVVSTSDQSAPLRLRAAILATRISEYFRDVAQKKVLLLMDSVTRLAMAQREIGLAVGEPPASRGYTPSVFSLLSRVLERSGMGEMGSITALYTVLVEGDDMNEPVADAVRGILDGHIALSRDLATANHFPAVDILESVSRLTRAILTPEEIALVSAARDSMALYRRNEDLINIGAYTPKTNPKLDLAIKRHDPLNDFLRQSYEELEARETGFAKLQKALT